MSTQTGDLGLGQTRVLEGDNPFNVQYETADYIATPQFDSELWSETMFFLVWSPENQIGIWTHVGVVPEDKTQWWGQTFVMLPDGNVLVDRSFGRPPGRSPDTGNLALNCVEPGKRWKLTFDGSGEVTTREKLAAGPGGAGPAMPFSFDVDLDAIVPIYDMHAAMGRDQLDWDMGAFHHEQSFVAKGTLTALGKTYDISGISVRDHSRGERHFGRFGGHVWNHCVWPESGRSLCVGAFWRPETHQVMASVAMIMEPGRTEVFNDFRITGATEPGGYPENIELTCVRADGSLLELRGEVVDNVTITYAEPNLNLNGNWSAPEHGLGDPILTDESIIRWEWTDGEVGWALMERAFRNSLRPCPISPLPVSSSFRDEG